MYLLTSEFCGLKLKSGWWCELSLDRLELNFSKQRKTCRYLVFFYRKPDPAEFMFLLKSVPLHICGFGIVFYFYVGMYHRIVNVLCKWKQMIRYTKAQMLNIEQRERRADLTQSLNSYPVCIDFWVTPIPSFSYYYIVN